MGDPSQYGGRYPEPPYRDHYETALDAWEQEILHRQQCEARIATLAKALRELKEATELLPAGITDEEEAVLDALRAAQKALGDG